MSEQTKIVVDEARRGTKGFPRYAEAYGIEPLTKVVPIDDGIPPDLVTSPPIDDEDGTAKFIPLPQRQFRDSLIDNGIMPDEVTEKINSIPFDIEREKAMNAWLFASEFRRDDDYIEMIAAMFELSSEDVDVMWLEATKEFYV